MVNTELAVLRDDAWPHTIDDSSLSSPFGSSIAFYPT